MPITLRASTTEGWKHETERFRQVCHVCLGGNTKTVDTAQEIASNRFVNIHINVKIEVHLAELVTTHVRVGNLVDILNVEVQLITNITNVKIEQDRQLKTQEETVKTKKKEENLSVFQELKENRIILFLKQMHFNQMLVEK